MCSHLETDCSLQKRVRAVQDRTSIPQTYQEKDHDISEGQSTPVPKSSLICSPFYLMAYIWPPLPWTTAPSIRAQASEERLWPGASSYFQVLFYFHSLASKWVQIDKMESFLLGAELGNQITPAKNTRICSPQHPSACKVPRWKFVSPAVLWHFYCLIIPLYGNLHRYGPAANETNCHKMLGKS